MAAGELIRPEDVVETQISRVLLTDTRAFKVRKPVRTSFLDYGTPATRLRMCQEEVRLGRRLAPSIYRGIRSIASAADGYRLGAAEDPDAADYAVEMRRFDPAATLEARLGSGEVDESLAHRVGQTIARFHRDLPPLPGRWSPATVAAAVHGNFEDLLGSATVEPARARAGQVFATAFLHRHAPLLATRSEQGHARDCHGDLRADHVVVEGDSIEVFDPLEFSPELRETDVCAEVAFLVMDLHRAGRGELAAAVLRGYGDEGGDRGPDELLYFYAAYRAWVRVKVAALRLSQLGSDFIARQAALDDAGQHVSTAERMAWLARGPLIVVVCGTAATGKSTVAAELARRSGLPHLSSDAVRKELAGVDPSGRAPAAVYEPEFNLRTYAELARRVPTAGAIVDATFRFRRDRDAFREALGPDARRTVFIECVAPESVVLARAAERTGHPERVSDADAPIALRQLREFDPLDEVGARDHLTLRTDGPVEGVGPRVEEALDLDRS
ncbi:MAG: bifunctional aminoglycoside phosphotransferase/ATP-binding protein [Candidatus Limnocylindria bacterium]